MAIRLLAVLCAVGLVAVVSAADRHASSSVCYSSGDPHVRPFTGRAYNNYDQGPHTLFSYHRTKAVARHQYRRRWGKRAVNSAGGLTHGTHKITAEQRKHGHRWRLEVYVNGRRTLHSSGRTGTLRFHKRGHSVFIHDSSTRMSLRVVHVSAGYMNLVLTVPTAIRASGHGLCRSRLSSSKLRHNPFSTPGPTHLAHSRVPRLDTPTKAAHAQCIKKTRRRCSAAKLAKVLALAKRACHLPRRNAHQIKFCMIDWIASGGAAKIAQGYKALQAKVSALRRSHRCPKGYRRVCKTIRRTRYVGTGNKRHKRYSVYYHCSCHGKRVHTYYKRHKVAYYKRHKVAYWHTTRHRITRRHRVKKYRTVRKTIKYHTYVWRTKRVRKWRKVRVRKKVHYYHRVRRSKWVHAWRWKWTYKLVRYRVRKRVYVRGHFKYVWTTVKKWVRVNGRWIRRTVRVRKRIYVRSHWKWKYVWHHKRKKVRVRYRGKKLVHYWVRVIRYKYIWTHTIRPYWHNHRYRVRVTRHKTILKRVPYYTWVTRHHWVTKRHLRHKWVTRKHHKWVTKKHTVVRHHVTNAKATVHHFAAL